MPKSATVITVNHIPAMHYLTNQVYYLRQPWTEFIRMPKLAILLDKIEQNNARPDYIIYAKSSGRNPTFPESKLVKSAKDFDIQNLKESLYIHNYIEEKKYNNVYENKGFILYKK